jgi:hypothetical protein
MGGYGADTISIFIFCWSLNEFILSLLHCHILAKSF